MSEFDPVNNPRHYTEGRQHEPIDVIEDWGLDFHLGNAVKYISRAGHKGDAVEDLEKAVWYIQREIDRLKRSRASIYASVVETPAMMEPHTAVVTDTAGTVVVDPPLDEPDIFMEETRLRDVS